MSITPRDELYVTLPSNVPGFSTNKPEEYTTTLPTPRSKWKLGGRTARDTLL